MKESRKRMSKGKAITVLVILCVLIAAASVLTFLPFDYGEDGIYRYKSVAGAISLGIDLKGGVYVVMQPDTAEMTDEEISALSDSTIEGVINIIRSRLAGKGYTEATVVRQTDLSGVPKIRVEIPDVDNPEDVFDIIGRSAVLEFRRPDGTIIFTGSGIEDAYLASDQDNQPAVGVTLKSAAQKAFAEATEQLVGQAISIYLDDELLSSPNVQSTITDKRFIITGSASWEDANDTAMLIKSGSLPIKFAQIEPRTLSSQLGQDAIDMGLIAGAIGIGLVFLFMGIYYKGFGLCANLALIVFIVLLLFLMSQLPWVQLTLPGIAGVVLSIGMAVDANVIIFERIRDEYRSGKTLRASIDTGFKRAMAAIFDSNLTQIISAVVLYFLGSGAIQGFAITVFIGVLVSFFTCLIVTNTFIRLFLAIKESGDRFYGIKRGEEVYE